MTLATGTSVEAWTWAVGCEGPREGVKFHARGDLLRYGWAVLAVKGREVNIPKRFVATFTVQENLTVEILITVEDGLPGIDAIKLTRLPGQPRLRNGATRLPYDRWTDWACVRVFDLLPEPSVIQSDRGYAEDAAAIRGRRQQVLDDDFLTKIAELYREAVRNHAAPIKTIMEVYPQAKDSTVRRWVQLARERGILPKTSKGKRAI